MVGAPLIATGSYSKFATATALSTPELLEIDQRRNLLSVAYLMGDEGASISQCVYSMYYLLWGVVNDRPDIITLLKGLRFSFACVLNPDRLEDVGEDMENNPNKKPIYRPKNTKKANPHNCPAQLEGVNLKHNYLPAFATDVATAFSNPCSLYYAGVPGEFADETSAFVTYLNQQGLAGVSLLVISK